MTMDMLDLTSAGRKRGFDWAADHGTGVTLTPREDHPMPEAFAEVGEVAAEILDATLDYAAEIAERLTRRWHPEDGHKPIFIAIVPAAPPSAIGSGVSRMVNDDGSLAGYGLVLAVPDPRAPMAILEDSLRSLPKE
jgi:hypothetical protein